MMWLANDYGGWWKALSDEAKDNFVFGYTTAMLKVKRITHSLGMDNAKGSKPGDPEWQAKMYESIDLNALSEDFDYVVDKPLRPALDEFYKEPLNTHIPPDFAMEYVRDELKGKKTAGQLLDELTEWRKIANSH